MILKCAITKFGNWKIFDDVHNLDYEYRSAKKFDDVTKWYSDIYGEHSRVYSWGLPNDNEFHDKGNFLVMRFNQNDESIFVLTQYSVYLMNDEGKTIERIRY